jgi:hypothetical protein
MFVFVLVIGLLPGFLAYPQQTSKSRTASAQELMRQQRYGDAINVLEPLLEADPANGEALAFLGAASLYVRREGPTDFLKSKELFERSFRSGGFAVFWVSHSHEKLGTSDLADYCRGWLYLRKGELEFTPENSEHGFRLAYGDVREFNQNRLLRRMFHIKDSQKTYNFRPRTATEEETLLIVALYKKFSVRGPN